MTTRVAAIAFSTVLGCGTSAAPEFSGAEPTPPAAPAPQRAQTIEIPPAAPTSPPAAVPSPTSLPPVAPAGASPAIAALLLAESEADEVHQLTAVVSEPLDARSRVVAAVLAVADEPFCPGPYPVGVLVAVVAEPPGGTPEIRSFHEIDPAAEGTEMDQPCNVTLALEVRDFDGDGSDEVSLLRTTSGHGSYTEITESTLFLLEIAPAIERTFELELSRSVVVNEPDCYEGDDPEGTFGVTKNDRATVVWSPGLDAALDLTVTREDFARECVRSMSPIHRRGAMGSCIQETTYGWSGVHHTWLPYRGLEASGFIVIGATGEASALEERRTEIAAGHDGFAPGYPAVVRTDEVAGLRPGLDILVLASCASRSEASAAKRALPPSLARHAEVRGIGRGASLPIACPTEITARPR